MYNSNVPAGMGTDYFLQVTLALVLVIGVIVLLSYLARRFNLFHGTGSGPIKVLSGISLGGKERLLLVQVGEEQLLLGTSPGYIQKLHKLREPIATEHLTKPLATTRLGAANRHASGHAPDHAEIHAETNRNPAKINFASIFGSVSRG